MLLLVRADDLDELKPGAILGRERVPHLPGLSNPVDCIDDDRASQPEVLSSHVPSARYAARPVAKDLGTPAFNIEASTVSTRSQTATSRVARGPAKVDFPVPGSPAKTRSSGRIEVRMAVGLQEP
ncbi:MAG: hypothetical protein L3K13_08025 [Thermoplasmata archaeon]|nr:hypothetical protein [Thermoplasmata archaeon]